MLKQFKILSMVGIFLLTHLSASDTNSSKKDLGLYMGLGLGWMKLKDDLTKEYFQTYPLVLQGGYNFTQYFSLEGRYIRSILNVKYENGTRLNPDDDDYPTILQNQAIYLKPIFPINNFQLYALLGYGEVSLRDIKGANRKEQGFQCRVSKSHPI